MKKILTSIMVTLLIVVTSLSGVGALTPEQSYTAAKDYYGKKTELKGADEVIAYESLGLQSDALKMTGVVQTDYASHIAKSVIALVLHGDDPRNYEGVNYVEQLEKCVHDNGAFDKEYDSTDANYQVYGVYALYVVDSPKVQQAADYLVSLATTSGALTYYDSYTSQYVEDLVITSWTIDVLNLINKTKYQTTIDKALSFIASKQLENAGYDQYGYGADANTQACVLMGLLSYDEAGVKGITYNKGDHNPYSLLLSFQNNNGSFWATFTGEGVDNDYATYQGVQAIGYYYNGSVYKMAYQEYQKLISTPEQKPVDEPEKEPVKEPEKEPVKTPDKEPIKDKIKDNTNVKEVVETSDSSDYIVWGCLLMMSVWGFMKGRKCIEQD